MEFPDSRIHEETLNVLLYEDRAGPDLELMQATSSRGAASMNYASDDEDDLHRKTSGSSRFNKRSSS